MTTFAIFANGTYWGAWDAETAAAAMAAAAADVGTEGNIDGLTAHEVSEAQVSALNDWSDAGSPASQCPINA